MATAQKRGFRLPWGDPHRDEPPSDDTSADATPDHAAPEAAEERQLASRLADVSEDLGGGPFGLSPAVTAETAPPLAGLGHDASESREATIGATADEMNDEVDEDGWVTVSAKPVATVESPDASPEAPDTEPGATPVDQAEAPAPAVEDAPAAPAPATTPASAWPTTDRGGMTQPAPEEPRAPVPSAAAPAARHDNPLVIGLVRAMREAARTARDETLAAFAAEAASRGEAIKVESAETAGELKKASEVDITAIREWSRAELARVREETDAKIAARRALLVTEAETEAQATEARLANLGATVERFESEMSAFFDALLAESDPARLAGLAERMPNPPPLDAIAPIPGTRPAPTEPRRGSAAATAEDELTEQGTVDEPAGDAAAVTEAEARAATETALEAEAGPEAEDAPEVEDEPGAEVEPADEAGAAVPVAVAAAPDHLDADAAAAAEAEALAGLDRQTNVVVAGLSSVAAIAGFKAALVHVDGVSAVSVTAGATGDVLFTVTHDGRAELRDALRAMPAFETKVIADDGASVSVVAREPGS